MKVAGSPLVVAIIGAGPTGTGLLERLLANVPDLLPDRTVEIHLVDPHPPGPGRVWRSAQSALLRMNSMAEDVTMFTDDSVTCEGPIRPGPTLAEWVEQMRSTTGSPTALAEELQATAGTSFPTRHLQSEYLAWVYDRVLGEAPDSATIEVHTATAIGLEDAGDGSQWVHLDDRTAIVADVVVLALGHLDADPTPDEAALAAFADRHGLTYVPPAYTADIDLDGIGPSATVLSRGMGLAFVDLVVLLTEGRGGRFVDDGGHLSYVPSGREPHILCGSRRGVPYHSKIGYKLQGPPPLLPHLLTADATEAALAGRNALDFRRDLWPLVAEELGWAHYRELFLAHPDRVHASWADFEAAFAGLAWDGAELRALVERTVPDPEDRLDLDALDRPLRHVRSASRDDLQDVVRAHVEADLARRRDAGRSQDMAVFLALLSCVIGLPRLPAIARLDPRSRVADVDDWWWGFFSFYASGPPADRLEQLLALSRAGIVEFLGAELEVRADDAAGRFVASTSTVPGAVEADALVEARLPKPSVARTTDRLLRDLYERGEVVEHELRATDGTIHSTGRLRVHPDGLHVVNRDGSTHPRRIAVGIHTSRPAAGAFARPRTNAPSFRQNDEVARHLLAVLATIDAERPAATRVSA